VVIFVERARDNPRLLSRGASPAFPVIWIKLYS